MRTETVVTEYEAMAEAIERTSKSIERYYTRRAMFRVAKWMTISLVILAVFL